jgi:hypothetical protein
MFLDQAVFPFHLAIAEEKRGVYCRALSFGLVVKALAL